MTRTHSSIPDCDRVSGSGGGAEARLLEIVLRQKRDEISQTRCCANWKRFSVMWRGDAVEVRALVMLARMYPDLGR